jgi:hypothetical protein
LCESDLREDMRVDDLKESKGKILMEISDLEHLRPEIIESVKNAGLDIDPENRFEQFARLKCNNYNFWINKRFDYLAFGKKKKESKIRAMRIFKYIFETGRASHDWVNKIDITNFFVTRKAGKPTREERKNKIDNSTTLDRLLKDLEFFEFIEKDMTHQRAKFRIRKEAAEPVGFPDIGLTKKKRVIQYIERKKRSDKQYESLHAALEIAKEQLFKFGVEDPDKLIHDAMEEKVKFSSLQQTQ